MWRKLHLIHRNVKRIVNHRSHQGEVVTCKRTWVGDHRAIFRGSISSIPTWKWESENYFIGRVVER